MFKAFGIKIRAKDKDLFDTLLNIRHDTAKLYNILGTDLNCMHFHIPGQKNKKIKNHIILVDYYGFSNAPFSRFFNSLFESGSTVEEIVKVFPYDTNLDECEKHFLEFQNQKLFKIGQTNHNKQVKSIL